jgi:hypothetical protein
MSKATTVRIDPAIQGGLKTLSRLLGKPVNKLVNDALAQYVKTQAGKMEVDLQQDIGLLRQYRELDPDLTRSVDQAVQRERGYVGRDPLEGELLPEGQEAPRATRK